ncbi:hypothetical protein PHYPO_G00222880 [Pangasianodon hypophthalmus]|uniref:Uncharacterized protein n=1 Tax=Pangasianodon hypophthalmus TaxID=310915 RepID=A0A5N5NXD2_PANHP|nr:hypothetical protein PHYPO_G00222880 [Pangasianodon hypophthalmus]
MGVGDPNIFEPPRVSFARGSEVRQTAHPQSVWKHLVFQAASDEDVFCWCIRDSEIMRKLHKLRTSGIFDSIVCKQQQCK